MTCRILFSRCLLFAFGLILLATQAIDVADAAQKILNDGVTGDGHMSIRSDQYGAFGPFSVNSPGFGKFDPDSGAGLSDWQFVGALMLANDDAFRWLMDDDDWPGDFVNLMDDQHVLDDSDDGQTRTSSFVVPDLSDLRVDLVQQTPAMGYNFVQEYTFHNDSDAALDFKVVWFNDQDVEFSQTFIDNRFGFVDDEMPRAYFIEDSDVAGTGDPGVDDRDRRVSIIANPRAGVEFDGYLGVAGVNGSATRLQNYLRSNLGILETDLNTIQEIDATGAPTGVSRDEDGDGLMDAPVDSGGAMQFSVTIPAMASVGLGFNYVGGSLRRAAFFTGDPGDYNRDGVIDAADADLQAGAIAAEMPDLLTFDENGDGIVDVEDRKIWVRDHAKTWIGDSNLDGEFSSGDLVLIFRAGKYETGETATWAEGDWSGDMLVGSGDLVLAFRDGGFELGPRPDPVAVPEPSSVLGVILTALVIGSWSRRSSGRDRQRV